MERLLFFQDSAPSEVNYLYKSFAKPKRMSPYGGVTTDSGAILLPDTARNPFGLLAQHDLLRFYTNSPNLDASYRKVVSVATGGASCTVDSAITLAGATNWEWMKASRALDNDAGQAAKGWVSVGGWRSKAVIIEFLTFPAAGLSVKIETRDAGQGNPSLYYATTFNTVNDLPQTFEIGVDVASLRVGVLAADSGSINNGSFTIVVRGDSAR